MLEKYVHGYSEIENVRLADQANTLNELLHHDSIFPKGSSVLEIGCGIGAQTEILCKKNPDVHFTSADISLQSVLLAESRCKACGITNVKFLQADVYNLPFPEHSFDHVFICFFLEHLPDPDGAIEKLKALVRQGGTMTVIEGDHGSAYYYPESKYAQKTIECLINLQAGHGGNSLIGRSLFPLLKKYKLKEVSVTPRMVYADASIPTMVDGFTNKTFIAMVEGMKLQAIKSKMISEEDWDRGIRELKMTAGNDGVFCYTFFKAVGYVI
jgi:ubiquinone/menaquinone biosynthesis C-methylase UbiE